MSKMEEILSRNASISVIISMLAGIFIISGGLMNPARSLAPALLSGFLGDLWLYWSATFVGTSLVAFMLRKKYFDKT